ncbi:LVIVD repeat-containing protein [Nocardia asteroides]
MNGPDLSRRAALKASLTGAAGIAATATFATACAEESAEDSVVPPGAYAHNVTAVGYCDLNGRPAFKMAIRQKAGRWYLYLGHFWEPGWSVVDVTDPAAAEVLTFLPVPGPKGNTIGNQVTLAEDLMLTGMEKVFPEGAPGSDPGVPFNEGVLLWDISDPGRPVQLGQWRSGGTGTHRNLYSGGRYAHLSAAMPGFSGNIYVVLDVSNPVRPEIAGRWWVPGQESGGTASARHDSAHLHGFCCGSGAHVSLHGPPYPVGDLVYLPYGAAGMIVLDISDVSRPRQIGHLPFSPPFHEQFGVHGVVPVPDRKIALVNSENITYHQGPAHHASIVDISDPAKPYLLSLLPEPIPPENAPYEDFTTRGGWRGPHNYNHHQYHPDVRKIGNLVHLAHFNAGLRIYDISNVRLPREVGYFLPPEPVTRHGYLPVGELVLQTEDVVVDTRGFIYITDKNQGLWILRYTGPDPGHADQ